MLTLGWAVPTKRATGRGDLWKTLIRRSRVAPENTAFTEMGNSVERPLLSPDTIPTELKEGHVDFDKYFHHEWKRLSRQAKADVKASKSRLAHDITTPAEPSGPVALTLPVPVTPFRQPQNNVEEWERVLEELRQWVHPVSYYKAQFGEKSWRTPLVVLNRVEDKLKRYKKQYLSPGKNERLAKRVEESKRILRKWKNYTRLSRDVVENNPRNRMALQRAHTR